jgi:hypothetical protein
MLGVLIFPFLLKHETSPIPKSSAKIKIMFGRSGCSCALLIKKAKRKQHTTINKRIGWRIQQDNVLLNMTNHLNYEFI